MAWTRLRQILALGLLSFLVGCGDSTKSPPATGRSPDSGVQTSTTRDTPAVAVATSPTRVVGEAPRVGGPAGYVSAAACKECHAEQHASWHASYHRTMTQLPGTNTVVAAFDGTVLETAEERFTLSRRGDEYWAAIEDLEEIRKAPVGRRSPPVEVRVGLVTGAHHMQVFWLPAGFGNAQIGFPFTWLVEDRRWAPRHEVFIRDPRRSPPVETWNMSCIRCHSTAGEPRPRKEQETFDTRVGDLGISCEACHGPGERHVGLMREHRLAGEKDPATPLPADVAVIQPEKLDKVRGSHVCAQCHSMKWFDAKEEWAEHGFRYRPGDDLEATTPVIRPSRRAEQTWLAGVLEKAPGLLDEFFWSDGMIRVAGREYNGLVETACHVRGGMSCLTCHSMHEYSDRADQLKPRMDGDAACVACHDPVRFGAGHTRHAAESEGSRCFNCHMPHTTYALLKGVRQHQIDSPRVATSLRTGRPNACNLCHVDRPLGWVADRLSAWYGQPVPEMTSEQQAVSETVRLALSGDAGQRALAAWHLGWEPAKAAAGTGWQAPVLAAMLEDPYSAVRYIAHRSLRTYPEFQEFAYDFVSGREQQREAVLRARAVWKGAGLIPNTTTREALLLRSDGTSDEAAMTGWQSKRDDRPMSLRE